MLRKEIEIINKIIIEATKHGGDAGGSYDSNEKNLVASIISWLELKGIANDYDVRENTENGYIQIIEKFDF